MADLLVTTTPLLCLPERFEGDCAATSKAYTVNAPTAGRIVVKASAVSGNIPQREECVHVRVGRTPTVDVCSTFSGISPAAVELPVDVEAGPLEITVEHLAAREFPPLSSGLCPWDEARPWLYWPPYPGAPACTPGSLRVALAVTFEPKQTTTTTSTTAPPSSTIPPTTTSSTPPCRETAVETAVECQQPTTTIPAIVGTATSIQRVVPTPILPETGPSIPPGPAASVGVGLAVLGALLLRKTARR